MSTYPLGATSATHDSHTAQIPRAIGYTRVSTGDQQYGIGAQKEAIRQAADQRGWEIDWIEEPARSGKNLERPKLQAALTQLAAGHAKILVVSRLDRLSRSLLDFTGLVRRSQQEGWALVVLNPALDLSTSEGRLVANILVSLAEFERELIGARIREGLAEAKRTGKKLGRTQRVPDDIARRVARERELGASLHEIARGLNKDGVPTARGGREWYAATIRGVLAAHEEQ